MMTICDWQAECDTFDIRFRSTLPRRLGLPPPSGPNRAEGVVVRCNVAEIMPIDNDAPAGSRVMYKVPGGECLV